MREHIRINRQDLIDLGFDWCDSWAGWELFVGEHHWVRWHEGRVSVGDCRTVEPFQNTPNDQIIGMAHTANELRQILARFN
jgi:hypothetical protein